MKLTTTILILFVCFGCIVKKKSDKAVLQPLFYDSAITTTGTLTINYDDYAKDTPVMGYLTTEDWNKFSGTVNQYDTQKVIMLVCDTSSFIEVDSHNTTFDTHGNVVPNATHDYRSSLQYGYTLNDVEYYNGTRMVATESNKYLDADKKPLSKSIIVWQTKELK